MSSILKFPLERVQRRSFGMHDLSHIAEVLLFEGVRYEKDMPAKDAHKKNNMNAAKVKTET